MILAEVISIPSQFFSSLGQNIQEKNIFKANNMSSVFRKDREELPAIMLSMHLLIK